MSKKLLARSVPLDEDLWGLAYPRLILWITKRHTLSPESAEDVAQEAIRQLLESGEPLPGDLAGLGRLLGSRANGVVANLRRKKGTTREKLARDGGLPEQSDSGFHERRILSAEFARKAMDILRERVAADTVLANVVARMAEGTDEPNELATLLNVDIQHIYNARRRLVGHADAVLEQLEEE